MINIYSVCYVTTTLKNPVSSRVGANIGSYKYCGKGDVTFLICYMTTRNHAIRVISPYHKLHLYQARRP